MNEDKFEFKEIDGWMWIKVDENHMEKLPEEIYDFGEQKIKIPGSATKWLVERLKKNELL